MRRIYCVLVSRFLSYALHQYEKYSAAELNLSPSPFTRGKAGLGVYSSPPRPVCSPPSCAALIPAEKAISHYRLGCAFQPNLSFCHLEIVMWQMRSPSSNHHTHRLR